MGVFFKIRKSLSLLLHKKELLQQDSYYPECPHKTWKAILWDQLRFLWRFGAVEPFYFTYGFDRKEMTYDRICNEYIVPFSPFQKRINYLNFQNPRYDAFHGKMTGRVITGDKFYFNIFLERFGIPTPKILLYIKDRELLYCAPGLKVSGVTLEEQINSFLHLHDMDVFAKPADGQLGKGIFALRIKEGKCYINGQSSSEKEVFDRLTSGDYLVQERIIQHPALSAFCPSSINSIRLQTVMDQDGNVIPFGAGLRMGRAGSPVDNWAKGGVFVGIDMANGRLMSRGVMKPGFGTSAFEHPDSKIVFAGFEIPYYKEAVQLAIRLHKLLYRCHSIGWDIAITSDGPVFVEGNGWWEISLVQATHGGMKQYEKYFM